MLNSGVLVLPSLSEGLPVVATDVSGISEIVKDGKTGFLVKPRDSKALSSRINAIIADEHLRKRMKSNALKEIKKYSWDNTVSRNEMIYQ